MRRLQSKKSKSRLSSNGERSSSQHAELLSWKTLDDERKVEKLLARFVQSDLANGDKKKIHLRPDEDHPHVDKGGFSTVERGLLCAEGQKYSLKVAVKKIKVMQSMKKQVKQRASQLLSRVAAKLKKSPSTTESTFKPDEDKIPGISLSEIAIEEKAMKEVSGCPFVVKLIYSTLKVADDNLERWFVMELCKCDLRVFLLRSCAYLKTDVDMKRREFLFKSSAFILTALVGAIQYLHQRFIIHRDIKEANFLISHLGVPKLCDFGLVKMITDKEATKSRQSNNRQMILKTNALEGPGTDFYTAPELVTQEEVKVYDFKVDEWSFGITAMSIFKRIRHEEFFKDARWQDLKGFYHLYHEELPGSDPHKNFLKRNDNNVFIDVSSDGRMRVDVEHGKYGRYETAFIEDFIMPFLILNRKARISVNTWLSKKPEEAFVLNTWKAFAENPKLMSEEEAAQSSFAKNMRDLQLLMSKIFSSEPQGRIKSHSRNARTVYVSHNKEAAINL